MPVEIMGEAGTPGADREWIEAECQLAIKHLKKVCGQLPPEMELEVQWQRPIGECDTWRFVRVHREVRGDSD